MNTLDLYWQKRNDSVQCSHILYSFNLGENSAICAWQKN